MEKVKFKIEYENGECVEITAKPKDFVAFERQYEMSMDDMRNYEHVAYLAWSPLHRQGRTTAAFDAWLDTVESVDELEEKPAVPFEPAVSGEKSPT